MKQNETNLQKSELKVAALQMLSSSNIEENIAQASALVEQAAQQSCELVVLPEYFCLMGKHDQDKLAIAEEHGSGPLQSLMAALAKKHALWLVAGSIPLKSPQAERTYNSCLVYDPRGQERLRYDKMHLFGFSRGAESYDESRSIMPGGTAPGLLDTEFGALGVGICYDLRFPEFFRAQGQMNIMALPAAFTYTTGRDHWEVLLRARAIENQCYVIASAQGGRHDNGRRTWGHSMIIDPWGRVMASQAENPGVVSAVLATTELRSIRTDLPALQHRVL